MPPASKPVPGRKGSLTLLLVGVGIGVVLIALGGIGLIAGVIWLIISQLFQSTYLSNYYR